MSAESSLAPFLGGILGESLFLSKIVRSAGFPGTMERARLTDGFGFDKNAKAIDTTQNLQASPHRLTSRFDLATLRR